MEKPPAISTAAGEEEDPISKLPVDILRSVFSLLSPKEIARLSLLSRRWRHLQDSYPVVEYYETRLDRFQNLCESTVKRFSRNKLLQMESLKIFVQRDTDSHRSRVFEQLLNLASERKAECVEITSSKFRCCFPFQLLSNSSVRILSLNNVGLFFDIELNPILSLSSLRTLHLHSVRFLDERIFANMIASCPLLETLTIGSYTRTSVDDDMQLSLDFFSHCPRLETLELHHIESTTDDVRGLRKLRISNSCNLKTLKVFYCRDLQEIEIGAPELRSFHLRRALGVGERKLSRFELIAPRLNVLEMINSGLKMVDLKKVVSKLHDLETLIVEGLSPTEKKRKFSDEILHSVLRRIPSPKETARTSLLSRRWRHLHDSYPVVEYYETRLDRFQKLCESTVKRFSRNKLLRMEYLKIFVQSDTGSHRSRVFEQLLTLASERKAELVEVTTCGHGHGHDRPICCFPFQLLSNSSLSTLSLNNVGLLFNGDKNLILSLNSLHSLHLHSVKFVHERIFANLIASCPLLKTLTLEYVRLRVDETMHRSLNSLRCLHLRNFDSRDLLNFIAHCPLLETLELRNFDCAITQWIEGVEGLRKLRISNLPNLKTLNVFNCRDVQEIEIAAPQLRSFRLRKALGVFEKKLSRIELIAPQLNVLKMINSGLNKVDLEAVVSKLRSLETLTIEGLFPMEKKIKLSGYKHDEIMLLMSKEFEEMELAAKREEERRWSSGMILRYEADTVIYCRTTWKRGRSEVREGEALTLLDAMQWAEQSGYENVVFEVDSTEVEAAVRH
ncbi:FBD-associated F-box protein At3g52670 [Linum perenne]